MRIISGVVPGVSRLARLQELSKKARQRLKWFDYYNSHGHNARLTCRHFDINPQTFYRWKRRYNPRHLESLEDRSRRPKHLRQPPAPVELIEAVLRLREEYPRWGKDKLVVLVREQGFSVSTSMVGRIIRCLKERGVLREPIRNHVSAHRRGLRRPYGKGNSTKGGHVSLIIWTRTMTQVRKSVDIIADSLHLILLTATIIL